ncbi:unnamed protein product, partial [Didymodactylos carnosus]
LGPVSTSKEENMSADEEVIIIPVEDILSIKYTSDIKKHVKAQTGMHKGCSNKMTYVFGHDFVP